MPRRRNSAESAWHSRSVLAAECAPIFDTGPEREALEAANAPQIHIALGKSLRELRVKMCGEFVQMEAMVKASAQGFVPTAPVSLAGTPGFSQEVPGATAAVIGFHEGEAAPQALEVNPNMSSALAGAGPKLQSNSSSADCIRPAPAAFAEAVLAAADCSPARAAHDDDLAAATNPLDMDGVSASSPSAENGGPKIVVNFNNADCTGPVPGAAANGAVATADPAATLAAHGDPAAASKALDMDGVEPGTGLETKVDLEGSPSSQHKGLAQELAKTAMSLANIFYHPAKVTRRVNQFADDGCSSTISARRVSGMMSIEEAAAMQAALNAHKNRKRGMSSLNKSRATCLQKLTRSKCFEIFFALMIVSNSVVLAVELEFQARNLGNAHTWADFLLTYVYNAIFLLELLLRVSAEGFCGFYCRAGNAGWAILDTVVACISVVELFSSSVVAMGSHENVNEERSENLGGLINMRIVRMIRVARMLRTFRAFRLFRFMGHLQTLLFSIFATLKSLAWATVLMFVIIYVFGVTFTQCAIDGRLNGADDNELVLLDVYWGSLDRSMGTLFQAISNGVSWRPAYELLNNISYLCGWLFLLFVIFAYFVLLNVVTGVFCNSAIESAQKNPELIVNHLAQTKKRHMTALSKLFHDMDNDNTGNITIVEFEALLQDDMANAQFQALELNIGDAWTLFKLIDDDGSGTVSIDEFLNGCEALKGGARSIDVAASRYENRLTSKKLIESMLRMEKMFSDFCMAAGMDDNGLRSKVRAKKTASLRSLSRESSPPSP